jgi:hypothetical protein
LARIYFGGLEIILSWNGFWFVFLLLLVMQLGVSPYYQFAN